MKKIFLTTGFLIVFILLFGVVSGAQQEDELVVGSRGHFNNLNPFSFNRVGYLDDLVVNAVYDELFYINPTTKKIEPYLAESWEFLSNGKELVVHIRMGVKAHNGEEVDAEDVAFTINRLINEESSGASVLDWLQEARVIDSYTVKLIAKPGEFVRLSTLTYPVVIVPESSFNELGASYFKSHAIGSGPFEFKEWKKRDHLILKKNEKYWLKEPKLQKIKYKPNMGSDAIASLKEGGVDIVSEVDPNKVSQLQKLKNIRVRRVSDLTYNYLGFNMQKSPFNSRKFRKAVYHSFDMNEIVEDIFRGGEAKRAYGPIPPASWASDHTYLKNNIALTENDEKAKELFDELRKERTIPEDFSTRIYTNEQRKKLAKIIANNLQENGINVSVNSLEWGNYLDLLDDGTPGMYLLGWKTDYYYSPYEFLYPLFSSEESDNFNNSSRYQNSTVDDLLHQAVASTEREVKFEKYVKAQRLIMNSFVHIPAYHTYSFVATRSLIRDFHVKPGNIPFSFVNPERNVYLGSSKKVSSRIKVQVNEPSGAIKGVKVFQNGEYKGKTNNSGILTISELTSGNYRIQAKKQGYTTSDSTIFLSQGEQKKVILTLKQKNKPPTASFTYLPSDPKTNQQINFSSDSSDKDGEIVQYKWEFGDGSRSSEENPVHRYSNPDIYTVELDVEDDQGATDTASREVKVKNREPEAEFNFSPAKPEAGQKITFKATLSTDPDGRITKYRWDLTGDGTMDKTGPNITYTYDTKGTYTIKLTVTDSNGASVSTTKEVKVTKKPGPEEEVKIEDRHALVIGISDYKHDTVRDLKYPKKDAQSFYQFLIDDNYQKFAEENTTLLTNEGATTRAIEVEMRKLVADVNENDLVIIYYSGYGAPGPDYNDDEDDGYDEYFVTYDTDTSSGAKLYSTGISDDQFANWLTSMESKQVAIFLDSCYSCGATKSSKGTTVPGQKAISKNEVFNDLSFENRLLFAASKENQEAQEAPKLNQGVFTHFLLKGLKGKADRDKDGKISADELYDYLKPEITNYVEENFSTDQTPLMKGAISAPLTERTGKLEGEIKHIKKAEKEEADKDEYVVINLGEEDGVKVGDKFEVFLTTKGVVFEAVNTVIEITQVAEPHLAVGKVLESGLTVKKGFKVRKAEND